MKRRFLQRLRRFLALSISAGDEYFALQYAAPDQVDLVLAVLPVTGKFIAEYILKLWRIAVHAINQHLQASLILCRNVHAIEDLPTRIP